ncbi:DUF1328 domain-containing protein [Polymorphobacter sp.]|uniref:DUF1328 domain-containing protein n=1 Tax=Polymorphobacter sp. TaxID=1909290 RepID=UPI003F701D0E
MKKGAVIFAIIALILGVLAFGGLVSVAWEVTKLLFWIALIIAVALAILSLTVRKKFK